MDTTTGLGIGAGIPQVPSVQYHSPGLITTTTSTVANVGHSHNVPEALTVEIPDQQKADASTPMARYLGETFNQQPWSAIHLSAASLALSPHRSYSTASTASAAPATAVVRDGPISLSLPTPPATISSSLWAISATSFASNVNLDLSVLQATHGRSHKELDERERDLGGGDDSRIARMSVVGGGNLDHVSADNTKPAQSGKHC